MFTYFNQFCTYYTSVYREIILHVLCSVDIQICCSKTRKNAAAHTRPIDARPGMPRHRENRTNKGKRLITCIFVGYIAGCFAGTNCGIGELNRVGRQFVRRRLPDFR